MNLRVVVALEAGSQVGVGVAGGEVGETVVLGGGSGVGFEVERGYSSGHRCRVEGCRESYDVRRTTDKARATGQGRGYCPKHYRQFLRTGNPEPRSVWARRALREAVFAWAENPTRETAKAVFVAATQLLNTSAGPVFDRDIDPDLAARLLKAADDYAWHDTSVAGDATFPAVSKALDEAALAFARSLARHTRLVGAAAPGVAA